MTTSERQPFKLNGIFFLCSQIPSQHALMVVFVRGDVMLASVRFAVVVTTQSPYYSVGGIF